MSLKYILPNDFIPKVPKESPPKFGHEMLQHWSFDPNYLNFNNGISLPYPFQSLPNLLIGSYGTVNKFVADYCTTVHNYHEANPDLFIRRTSMLMIPLVRQKVSKIVNAPVDTVVLVPNTTHGINTILRNYKWSEGDYLVNCESRGSYMRLLMTHICSFDNLRSYIPYDPIHV